MNCYGVFWWVVWVGLILLGVWCLVLNKIDCCGDCGGCVLVVRVVCENCLCLCVVGIVLVIIW